ncbi:MAG: MBL fold metallo-hydrolase [Gammaproteobacteria bacterium]
MVVRLSRRWLFAWWCVSILAPPALADVESLGDGAYLYRAGEHRSLFLVDAAGVIVTDPISADVAADYRAAIRRITAAPIRYVVYSHYHWDRVSGAQIFADEGAEVVAQERCAERFADNPNPAVVMPDVTFDDRHDVTVGNATLELHYFGPSHGDCLTVFVAQPANVIQVVDLVNPPRAAFPRDPNVPYIRPHNLRQFFASVQRLIDERGIEELAASAAFDIEIGDANGDADSDAIGVTSPPLGPASIVADQARFWNEVYATVEIAIAQGYVGIDSFVRMHKIDQTPFEAFSGYSEADLRFVMRRISGWHDMGR